MSQGHGRTHYGRASQDDQSNAQKAVYKNNEADDNVDQHNGPSVEGRILMATCQFDKTKSEHRDNIKRHRGRQTAGLLYRLPQGPSPSLDFIPVAPGHWEGLKHEGMADAHRPGECEQILGTVVEDEDHMQKKMERLNNPE